MIYDFSQYDQKIIQRTIMHQFADVESGHLFPYQEKYNAKGNCCIKIKLQNKKVKHSKYSWSHKITFITCWKNSSFFSERERSIYYALWYFKYIIQILLVCLKQISLTIYDCSFAIKLFMAKYFLGWIHLTCEKDISQIDNRY